MVAVAGQNHGNAKRIRHTQISAPNITTMTTVLCEQCGHQYVIEHRAGSEDVALASRQAAWLAENFVWDHIQENRHSGSIRLPFLAESELKAH
jgi:hypothetical protein